MRRTSLRLPLAALAAGAAIPLVAHGLGAEGAGFAAGLSHPVGGLDHLLAMVAIGMAAAQQGGKAMWGLPLAFMAGMALGAAGGLAGLALPGVELGILASLLMLGIMVGLRLRPPLAIGLILVAAAALFHGHAHGAELPEAATPLPYATGFLLATATLHGAGIAATLVAGRRGQRVIQAAGAAIAATGGFLFLSS